jgi:hypothetical protein
MEVGWFGFSPCCGLTAMTTMILSLQWAGSTMTLEETAAAIERLGEPLLP